MFESCRAHQPSLTLANAGVSYGWQATTNAHACSSGVSYGWRATRRTYLFWPRTLFRARGSSSLLLGHAQVQHLFLGLTDGERNRCALELT